MLRRKPLVILSDGASPTEDIYFLRSAAPFFLKNNEFLPIKINCTNPLVMPSTLKNRKYNSAHLIIIRSLPKRWLIFIEENRQLFSTITYLIDDDFSAASLDDAINYLPKDYVGRLLLKHQLQDRFLSLADAVVTSCDFLFSKLSRLHENVHLLLPSFFQVPPSFDHFNNDLNSIIYPGTRSHLNDLDAISLGLISAFEDHDAQSDTHLHFFLGRHLPEIFNKKTFTKNNRPMSWEKFLQYQSVSRFHIGLAPLMDTPFNRGKSWNKFLDITAFGAVGLFSHREPYKDIVLDGVNGLLVNDDMLSWKESLLRLLNYPADTFRMAQSAQKTAKCLGDRLNCYNFWQKLFKS